MQLERRELFLTLTGNVDQSHLSARSIPALRLIDLQYIIRDKSIPWISIPFRVPRSNPLHSKINVLVQDHPRGLCGGKTKNKNNQLHFSIPGRHSLHSFPNFVSKSDGSPASRGGEVFFLPDNDGDGSLV